MINFSGKYNAYEISKYVINYYNDNFGGISNLKLQKILYFIQAAFLLRSNNTVPAFTNEIQAWDFGPVVPDIYRKYKIFGGGNIPTEEFDESTIEVNDKMHIAKLLNNSSKYSTIDLVELTHKQAPWKDVYNEYVMAEITNDSIYKFFNEKKEEKIKG